MIGRADDESERAVMRMVASIRHRGPDAQETRRVSGATLGHARLSIIDLDAGGQPMQSADGRFWMVFNGEIYNYRDLRAELEKSGAVFRTHSDTEVLMEFVRHHGTKRLAELNGMFAFALWDAQERTLVAARDRLGKKPFYFAKGGNGSWVFGSEVRALLASGQVENRVDADSLEAFLALGYLPPDRSIYKGVGVIPPAHALIWKNGEVSLERYWQPDYTEATISQGEAVEKLRWLLNDAVKLRLLASDVPVGAFLSGGLDSSTVVALAQRASSKPLQTFSIRIKDHGRDETPFAREVAAQAGCEHHEFELDLDVAAVLRQMADIYDEPFADPSNIPTYMVSKFARERLKVVLTGDGGDELFGGYDESYRPLLESSKLPSRGAGYRALAIAATLVPSFRTRRELADEARQFPDVLSRHMIRSQRMKLTARRRLQRHAPKSWNVPLASCPASARNINRAFWFDTTTYLPGDILVKVDRAAMAVGLEPRSPILDPRIVDFSMSLPVEFKISGSTCKKIFRDSFQHVWPESLRLRSKMGFGVPEEMWLRREDVRAMARELMEKPPGCLGELFDMKAVCSMVEDYFAGHRALIPLQVWTLLSFFLWCERWKPLPP